MFDKEYSFYGLHAEKVNKLTAPFDSNSSVKLFNRNLDVYILAPIIGFIYGRKSIIDKSISLTASIFPEQLLKEQQTLKYIYQLIMLVDNKKELSFEDRLNKAFRNYSRENSFDDQILYEQYVLGGVEVLYEKLIESNKAIGGYINTFYDFIDEFHERYHNDISTEKIIELSKK